MTHVHGSPHLQNFVPKSHVLLKQSAFDVQPLHLPVPMSQSLLAQSTFDEQNCPFFVLHCCPYVHTNVEVLHVSRSGFPAGTGSQDPVVALHCSQTLSQGKLQQTLGGLGSGGTALVKTQLPLAQSLC
jgi:hypothetical protein